LGLEATLELLRNNLLLPSAVTIGLAQGNAKIAISACG
jgi:hypothetical protein